jgi:TetR/AcrR family transcriptional regulator
VKPDGGDKSAEPRSSARRTERNKLSASIPPLSHHGRRRPVSIAAREAILKAAEEEFAEHGFGGARAQSIATRAGVNKALPFYHFGSKAELYEEVVRRALVRLGQFMSDALVAPTPRERLASFVHRLFAYLADNPNWCRLIVRELIDEQSHARELATEYLEPLVEQGRTMMLNDMATGGMRRVDQVQAIVSITVETFGYFLLLPALHFVGITHPLSPAVLAARERMVVDLLSKGLGLTGPDSGSAD